MPSPEKRSIAARYGPHVAGAVKTVSRRYVEQQGLTFRQVANRIAAEQGITITPSTIRYWANAEHWTVAAPLPCEGMGPSTRRKDDRSEKRAKQDAIQCRRRCPICLKPDGEGGHECIIRVGRRLTVFGGGYL